METLIQIGLNTRGFTISVPVFILPVFPQLLLRNGKICFEMSEHSVQTADYNSKYTSQALQLTLVLHIFKFRRVIEGVFSRHSMVFTDMLCRFTMSHDYLLLKEHAHTKYSSKLMPGTWLFGAPLWKIIKVLLLYEILHASLFYDRRSWNSECLGQWQGLMVFDYLNQVHWHINMSSLIFKKAKKAIKKSLYSNLFK